MHELYTVAQLRTIEQAAQAPLMQRAGHAAANAALELLAGLQEPQVLVLAGPGNNGGDAFEVAANLADAGIDVAIIHVPGTPSPECARALARAQASSAQFVQAPRRCSLVIDGLFGIGLARPIEGAALELVNAVNAMQLPVMALDVPSGLDADTGALVGNSAIHASHTITFIGDKPGLHTCEGREYAGEVMVATLDIGASQFPPAAMHLNDPGLFATCLKPRSQNSHKGSHGNVAIVGGAHGMAGAPVLAARAALLTGAGRVYVAAVDPGPAFDAVQPEVMFRIADTFDFSSAALVVGPGMGISPNAERLLARALGANVATVIDADALNMMAASGMRPHAQCILTPHPLEAARLLQRDAAAIQADRVGAARELAAGTGAIVVLKGSGTVIAAPNGRVVINQSGNAGLATAGTGDVLAGMCGSLLAQGWPCWEAALGAVWIHGTSADRLVAGGFGPIGLTAGELPGAARAVLNALVARPGAPPQS
ncbi:MAG: NAD(P)H-hydrate dehydratase [Pseudomonadota bacterium]